MKKLPIVIAAIVLAIIGFFVAKYLSGVIYYLVNKTNPFGEVDLSTWGYYWDLYSETDLRQKKKLQGAVVAAIFITFVLPFMIIASLFNKVQSLHGDARFATASEVQESGLMGSKGILVGKFRNKYLMLGGQQFVLLAAPTRSGKGVAIVIPNLLNFSDSVVVLDLKLENFFYTSKFRAVNGQLVYLFNPFAETLKTHRWNPFDEISHDENFRIGEIIAMGRSFYPVTGDPKADFWADTANNLFLGLALYLFETEELPTTMGEILRQSSGKGQPLQDYLSQVIEQRQKSDRPLSDICVDALNRFLGQPENTLGNTMATFTAPLTMFTNPVVDAATSASDFTLSDVRKKRMSIYFGVQPNRLGDAKNLINLFFSMLFDLNLKELPQQNSELKYQCLSLMDEFTAVGIVQKIADSNSFIAGYNMRLLTIIQSIGQLEDVYKTKTRALVTNHALQIVYPPREQKDANEYSEMLGYFTFKAKSTGSSRSRSWGSNGGGSTSENESDQRRALMLPQELKEMPKTQEIIFMENTKPILAEKARYYDDPIFMGRLNSVSKSMGKIVQENIKKKYGIFSIFVKKGFPTQSQLEKLAFEEFELSIPVPVLDIQAHKARVQNRIKTIETVEEAQSLDLSSLKIDEFKLDKTVFKDPENPKPEEAAAVVDQFFSAFEWEEDTEAKNMVDDFFAQVESQDYEDNSVEAVDDQEAVAVDEYDMTNAIEAVDDQEAVAVDEYDMTNAIEAVDDQEAVAVDEYDMTNAIEAVDDQEAVAVDEYDMTNAIEAVDDQEAVAVDKTNTNVDISDLDEIYTAFSKNVNSK
ncbi:type IV secretory system conjugative DNA transfer family protein [Acinetobacter calcoaceticus]|uniref:type IV secretory system conjugative DNA transfer family protein n=1 Tax=Acinetobacter calcoaceticus TaxID=471 RepID=UPI00124C34FB|nr:type IV secretory system conjugative DNA transfer family protein [Acinetobacter calcoaceticus]